MKKWRRFSKPEDYPEDFESGTVSLNDLEDEIDLQLEEEEDFQDFYLPPEKPLKFE